MEKVKNRITALCCMLVVGLVAVAADFTEGYLAYNITGEKEVAVVGLSDYSDKFLDPVNGYIIIPSFVEKEGVSYRVTEVGGFSGAKLLYGITIPSTVVKLDAGAFTGSNIRDVVFDGVSELKEIGQNAFKNCANLKGISIPESVVRMGDDVFRGCSALKQVELNASINCVPAETFLDCSSLEDVVLSPVIQTIGNSAFKKCKSLKPDFLTGNVRIYEDNCFQECDGFTHVDLPEGLVWISDTVFLGCRNLICLTLPVTLRHIGKGVGSACYSLKLVNFKEYVEVASLEDVFPCENTNFVVSTTKGVSDLLCIPISRDRFKTVVFMTDISDKKFYMSIDGNIDLSSDMTIVLGPYFNDYGFDFVGSASCLYLRDSIKPSFGWAEDDSLPIIPVNRSDKKLDVGYFNFSFAESDKVGTGFTLNGYESKYEEFVCLKRVSAGIDSNEFGNDVMDVKYDVYTMDGILVANGIKRHEIDKLPSGMYLLRGDGRTVKVVL